MGKELVTTAGNVPDVNRDLPESIAELIGGLANMETVSRSDGTAKKSGLFMKFSKGEYFFGTDQIEPEEGSLWAVNPNSFVHGYQAWGDGQLLGEVMVGMREAPVSKSSLEEHTYTDPDSKKEVVARWQAIRGFDLVCVEGDDEGTACTIAGTSLGLTKAVSALIAEVMEHLKEDPSTPVPLVKLESNSYKHKKYGKIHTPEFPVVKWADLTATEVPDDEDEPDEVEENQEQAPDAPDAESEKAEESAEAPKRRRRRRG